MNVSRFAWPTCDSLTINQTLSEMAAAYDLISEEKHIAGDGLLRDIQLTEDLQGVENWYHLENTILWSGMYLAAQAFRYAATKSPKALENAKIVVEALGHLTAVTGVKGLYGRSISNPAVSYPAIADDNPGWTNSPAEGYEGWRYRNDVSKDGYAGLMFGYAAAMDHFKDETLRQTIKTRIHDITTHIISNKLQIIGANGEVTEHGRLYQSAWDDYPGFNAMLAASWVKIAITETDDADFESYYDACMMDPKADERCRESDTMTGSYLENMENNLFLFLGECKENYDNFDMCYQAMYPLFIREHDAKRHEDLLRVLNNNMFHTENPNHLSLAGYGNTFFTFLYAAMSQKDPAENSFLFDAVDRSICTLKQFPPVKFQRGIPISTREQVCLSRLDTPRAETPLPLSEYHFDNYLWRLDFYEMYQQDMPENRRYIYSPEDFLVAYWLGRYIGILEENQ